VWGKGKVWGKTQTTAEGLGTCGRKTEMVGRKNGCGECARGQCGAASTRTIVYNRTGGQAWGNAPRMKEWQMQCGVYVVVGRWGVAGQGVCPTAANKGTANTQMAVKGGGEGAQGGRQGWGG